MRSLALIVFLLLNFAASGSTVVSPIYDMPEWPETAIWDKTDFQLEADLDVSAGTLVYQTVGIDEGAQTTFRFSFEPEEIACFSFACILQVPTTAEYGAQIGVYGVTMDTDPQGEWWWTMRAWDYRTDYAIATAGGIWDAAETTPEPHVGVVVLVAGILAIRQRRRLS